jgi:hypothetical protein
MVIVMGRVTGLPATGFPLMGSIALMITFVVIVVPPVKLVVSTLTFIEVVVPPAKFVPEAAESENGAPELSAAVQFNGDPPLFVITTGWEIVLFETLFVILPGLAANTGLATTFRVIGITCGLPLIAIPPFIATSEIEAVYVPAARPIEVTDSVKVALPPLVTAAVGDDIASQPVPLSIVIVGVIVTFPAQAPIIPTVKVCFAGFKPASGEKVSVVANGVCNVHTGCTFNVTIITLGLPTANFVTLSMAVKVTEPVYIPVVVMPFRETPTLLAEGAFTLTRPVGVAVSHAPPAVVAVVAAQFSA